MKVKLLLAVCTMAFSGLYAQIPTNGLLLHYPLDGNTDDASGNGRHAIASDTWYVTGAGGSAESALSMDGDSSSTLYYDYTNEWTNFNFQEFTVATWVKMDDFNTLYSNIFEMGYGQIFLRFVSSNPTIPQFGYFSQTGEWYGSGTSAPGQMLTYWQEWHHIALSSYPSGYNRIFTLYVDGIEVYTTQINGTLYQDALINHNAIGNGDTKVKIGYRTGDNNLAMDGSFQDYFLYNRVLTPSEITQLKDNLCYATSHSITASACGSYSLNGEEYTSSGQYTQTLTNADGCDSLLTLNLTINQVNPDVSVVSTVNGAILESNDVQNQTTFQWIDCDNGMAQIEMANSSTFSPASAGNYAVIVHNGACMDTSACISFIPSGAGLEEHTDAIRCYPNPAQGMLYFTGIPEGSQGNLINQTGQIVRSIDAAQFQNGLPLQSLPAGTYIIQIRTDAQLMRQMLIKE